MFRVFEEFKGVKLIIILQKALYLYKNDIKTLKCLEGLKSLKGYRIIYY